MKNKFLSLIPYLIIMAAAFYLFPLLIADTGSAMFVLLLAIPLVTLICSLVYGIFKGFNLWFAILTMILFAPTIIIFYNISAWVYILNFGGIAVIGNALGALFHKKQA